MAEKKSKPKTKTNPKKTATGKANPKKGKPDPIEELKNNLSQEQDKYLRLFAEFENFKKRTSRERIELFKTAGQEVISSLLPILDDFERAVNNTPEEQNKEIEAITTRWQADSMSDSWLSKNVRPLVLVWCITIFSLAGILDSVESIPFQINSLWNDTFEKVMMAVVLAYFGGRTTEKATSLFKGK